MTEEELSQTYLERPYTVFLFKSLTRIYEKWIEDNPVGALMEALKLVVLLPTNVKEIMWPDKEIIEKDLRSAYGTNSVDWFCTQLVRNRQARRIAQYYIEPFVDEMTRLLDQKGWLERGALKARYETKTKLTA